MGKEQQISVGVYGHDFNIRVEPDKREILEQAARLVDERMREIAGSGIVSIHKVAMLAAIDIAFQAIDNIPEMAGDGKASKENLKLIESRIGRLIQHIDSIIDKT